MDYDNVDNVWHSIVLVGMVKMILSQLFLLFSFFVYKYTYINTHTFNNFILQLNFCR